MQNFSEHFNISTVDSFWMISARWLICSIGVIANLVVIVVFVYNNTYRKSLSHTLLLHLSITDLVGCALYLVFFNSNAPSGLWGRVFCKSRVLFWYTSATSTYNLVMLTIERYIAVVHPLFYRTKSFGQKRTVPLLILHVLGSLTAFQVGITADLSKDVHGECVYNYSSKLIAVVLAVYVFSMCWLIPVSVMGFCYTRILLKLNTITQLHVVMVS
ncbi:somatostatin receptor type 4-like [Anneissia japonica]|uniref:somatostatin receptor type 4-like n=1 Tax=Anneissia japonica TaxID=1529436 RepID=UPI001425B468|nr:somatostatin receptor type 4-like [Anneissia japonica]